MRNIFSTLKLSTVPFLLMALALASYSLIRVATISQAAQKVKSTGDTPAYIRISQEPVLDREFLAGSRPLLFPLLIKIARGNLERVAWMQGIFSIISWGVLAVCVAYSLRNPFLQLASLGLILLFSLYRYIIGWDSVMLTESLALSLMALFIASWLWLAKGWQWGKVLLICVVALLWAFTRDTNAWIVLLVALLTLLLIGFKFINKRYLIFPVVFIAIFLINNGSADLGGRWIFPFQNVLSHRILPNASATNFFVTTCGMPLSPALVRLEGEWSGGQDRAFYLDPALDEYRSWLFQSGKSCYMKWLMLHPLKSVQDAFAEFEVLIGMQDIQFFLFSKRFLPILPGRVESVLFPDRFLWILLAITCVQLAIAVFAKAWMQNKAWGVAMGMNLLVLPHYFIVWNGDVMGIQRHVMIASAQFYLGMWITILLFLDLLFSFKRFERKG